MNILKILYENQKYSKCLYNNGIITDNYFILDIEYSKSKTNPNLFLLEILGLLINSETLISFIRLRKYNCVNYWIMYKYIFANLL